MSSGGSATVFFLGNRAHYQVLDTENGSTSTETIYETTSSEELWPSELADRDGDKYESTDCLDRVKWNFEPSDVTMYFDKKDPDSSQFIKRRFNRSSGKASDDFKPEILNRATVSDSPKHKPSRRTGVMQFLASLSRRKRRMQPDNVQYLKHMNSDDHVCTFRESCRCLDCQSRYFDCRDDSEEDYNSDEDFNVFDLENPFEPVDEVFLEPKKGHIQYDDFDTRDKLVDHEEQQRKEEGEQDQQLQLEVAASTSVVLNLLLYHPFSCAVQ